MAKIPKVLHSKSAQTIVLFFSPKKAKCNYFGLLTLFFIHIWVSIGILINTFCVSVGIISGLQKKTTHFFGITENKKIKYWDSIGLHGILEKKWKNSFRDSKIFSWDYMGLYGIIWDYVFFFCISAALVSSMLSDTIT